MIKNSEGQIERLQKIASIINHIIYIAYLALAIITPLIFTTKTTEIYEVPKMFFVYFATTVILFLTIFKFTLEKKIMLPTNLPILAFTFFLLTQIASTVTSTDTYTSIFGYPTRLNGGLLSIISYFILFAGAFINLNTEKVKNLTLVLIFTAVTVALWGIPSHFNSDPTCYVLTGKLTTGCWQKEFNPQLRIFSTFGQPNWLASYMVLTLPVALSLTLTFKKQKQLIFAAASTLIFWALILTNSRSGLLGLAVSLGILTPLLGIKILKLNLKILIIILIAFAIISLSFADLVTSRIKDTLQSSAPAISQTETSPHTQSSLTSGGTESGQIRLIVWQGAISIFKRWPILGPGPETFVNAYYLYRPKAQNQTSEWEFFYNKAHNEFLNYLSTTGILGLLGFSFLCISIIISIAKFNNTDTLASNFQKAVLASVLGYLVTIFFGFSTVANQTTFLLSAALAIILSGKTKIKIFYPKYLNIPLYKSIQLIFLTITFTYTLTLVGRIYFADSLTARAQNLQGAKSLLVMRNAITASPVKNPYLMSDFAYNTALYANIIENQTNKEVLISQVKSTAQETLQLAPNNYLITQKIAKSYIPIVEDKVAAQEAMRITTKLIQLAPTYPPAYLLSAQIYVALEDQKQARTLIQKTLELKSDYREAQKLYQQLTVDN